MKNAMELLMRMSQLATGSNSENLNPSSSGWDEASTTNSDVRGEGSGGLKSYQQTRGSKYEENDKTPVREKEVIVDSDAAVVRELNPRLCHK